MSNCRSYSNIESQLPDFGYYPTDKKGEYLGYETESDLRDTENVPLKEPIYNYFVSECFGGLGQPRCYPNWI